jgi:integrase
VLSAEVEGTLPKWGNHTGKERGSRRRIPPSTQLLAILQMRRAPDWIFPVETKSGHIERSKLKKQHAAALKDSGAVPLVLCDFRPTCVTPWAKHMAPFTLQVLAGHTDMNTIKRYVRPSEADILEAMEKLRVVGRPAGMQGSQAVSCLPQ